MLVEGEVIVSGDDVAVVRQIILRMLMAARITKNENLEDEIEFLKEVLFHAPDAYEAKPFFDEDDDDDIYNL